jgi:SAM-dependent methyltransferase
MDLDCELTAHARRNEAYWTAMASEFVESARRNWSEPEPSWGIWNIPEADVRALPDVAGLDAVELGCGTAYFSAWLTRRGASPVGVDLSEGQLATARALQAEHGLEFPLVHASAEDVPLPDASFDFALSEYGASLWCDPDRWLPEAARLLRPGGRLVFLTNSALLALCTPANDQVATERLVRDQFGMKIFEWDDAEGANTEFHLPHGELIRVLRAAGFEIEALHELQAPAGATTSYDFVTPEWARRWPSEEIWVAVRASG